MYEEGEGLDEDEIEEYQRLLPQTLVQLPGGGLKNGSIVTVQDQSQGFSVDLIITHQVAGAGSSRRQGRMGCGM